MNKIKQEKGVTLLILVITIIVLLILAGVAINSGTFNLDSTVDSKLEGELKMVQYAVFQQYAKYKSTLDESSIITGRHSYTNEDILKIMSENYKVTPLYTMQEGDEAYKRYYLLSPYDLTNIGIQESQYSYIVNYYTGEVMNADIFETNSGKILYVKGIVSTEQLNQESY